MKIAIKAPNGLYVSAEQGGGVDSRQGGIALRARATTIGPWETFDRQPLSHTTYALRTCDGWYVTAEGGGGSDVRTNERDAGVWETFTGGDLLLTWDGAHKLGLAAREDPVIDAREGCSRFTVESLEPLVLPDRRIWRGSFCMPAGLPGSPYGDGARIWTPAYGCYDDYWRTRIRDAYLARRYTHFVYNAAGLPYGSDYPELADDPDRVARDLDELLGAGLVPVVACTDDRHPTIVLASVRANAPRIPVCFPCWEMNGPLGNPDKAIEEQNQKNLIVAVRSALPDADCWLHFTPGHGSISYADECEGWRWCQDHGTIGLLGQGSNSISDLDPLEEGKGFETTAARLAGDVGYVVPDWDGGSVPPNWEGLAQLSVKFEWGIYESYHGHVTEADLNAFTDAFMTVAKHVNGFCDGGS